MADWFVAGMVLLLLGIEVWHMTHHDHKKCECSVELEEIQRILREILGRLPAPPPLPTGGTIKQLK